MRRRAPSCLPSDGPPGCLRAARSPFQGAAWWAPARKHARAVQSLLSSRAADDGDDAMDGAARTVCAPPAISSGVVVARGFFGVPQSLLRPLPRSSSVCQASHDAAQPLWRTKLVHCCCGGPPPTSLRRCFCPVVLSCSRGWWRGGQASGERAASLSRVGHALPLPAAPSLPRGVCVGREDASLSGGWVGGRCCRDLPARAAHASLLGARAAVLCRHGGRFARVP